jgi:predicted DNA-binding transcriptional regulator YafY
MNKLLLRCQLENRPVDIIYIDQQGRITKRTIFVKKIDQEKVIAFCTVRNQNRTFYLRNILAAQKGAYYEYKQNYSWKKSNVGS